MAVYEVKGGAEIRKTARVAVVWGKIITYTCSVESEKQEMEFKCFQRIFVYLRFSLLNGVWKNNIPPKWTGGH